MSYPPRLGEAESQILHALQDVLVELKAIRRILDNDRPNTTAIGQPPRPLTGEAATIQNYRLVRTRAPSGP